jgi:uncharacterized protein
VLDEFQEISALGGDRAEWHLRGAIQHHQHVSYIFAGSKPHLIRRMILEQEGAFYGMLDPVPFGPIDPTHLARWIDERLRGAGVTPEDAGLACVELAGPRTRDIVQVASKCFDRAGGEGAIGHADVAAAFREVIDDLDDTFRALWESIRSAPQQNVLRAVAASTDGLTTGRTRTRFSLNDTGKATNAAKPLVETGRLVRTDTGSGYAFDNPFFRGWVILRALPDLGIELPVIFRASTHTGLP